MLQRFMSLALVLILATALFPAVPLTIAVPSGVTGYGSNGKFLAPIDPPVAGSIAITSENELNTVVRSAPNGKYHLTRNLDLSVLGADWVPIGSNAAPLSGILDGQGFVIRSLRVTGETAAAGLFSWVINGTIKNVGLEDTYINISNSSSTQIVYASGFSGRSDNISISNCYNTGEIVVASAAGGAMVGGVCSTAGNYTPLISYSYNTANVSVTGNYTYVGGVLGYALSADLEIRNCYNTGNITAFNTSSTVGARAGGIFGVNFRSSSDTSTTISDCYNTGNVSASSANSTLISPSSAGGIMSSDRHIISIKNSYNTGNVSASVTSGEAFAGAIIGKPGTSMTVSNSYWNSDSIQTVNGNPQIPKRGIGDLTNEASTTPLTTADMKMKNKFAGFDFVNIWGIKTGVNNGYPFLIAQKCPDCGARPPCDVCVECGESECECKCCSECGEYPPCGKCGICGKFGCECTCDPCSECGTHPPCDVCDECGELDCICECVQIPTPCCIDYSEDDTVINGEGVNGFEINLTSETIKIPAGYKPAAFSIDGGTKWKAAKADTFSKEKFPKLLNKNMTLHISDKPFNKKAKSLESGARVVTFATINKRAVVPKVTANYLIGANEKSRHGDFNGQWLLMTKVKKGETSVIAKDGLQIGLAVMVKGNPGKPDKPGKTVDLSGWGRFHNGDTNGICVKALPAAGKVTKTTYYFRAEPKDNKDGTYTAASKHKKVTATSQLKPPKYSVKKKAAKGSKPATAIIKVKDNTYVSISSVNNGEPALSGKGNVSVLGETAPVVLWQAASSNGKKAASAKQTIVRW